MKYWPQFIEIVWQSMKSHKIKSIVYCLIQQKQIKGFMIVSTHAVTNPKTMMVKSFYAHLTFFAMFRTVIACDIAFRTDIFWRLFWAQKAILSIFSNLGLFNLLNQLQLTQNRSRIYFITSHILFQSQIVWHTWNYDHHKGCCDITQTHMNSNWLFLIQVQLENIEMATKYRNHWRWNETVVKRLSSLKRLLLLNSKISFKIWLDGNFTLLLLHINDQKIMIRTISKIIRQQSIKQVHTWLISS